MKHIEYKSTWKYSSIWILHDVFIINGIVWSWEMRVPLLWQWQFVLYREDTWRKECVEEIILEEDVADIDLSPYKNIKLRGVNCVEILDKIMRENNAWFIVPFWFYVYRKLQFATIYIMLLVATFFFWLYWFTMSEEEYQLTQETNGENKKSTICSFE